MSEILLHTKIHRPPVPKDIVLREGLYQRLDVDCHRPLILVSAPAGYGKSLLISSWLERSAWPSAWISLDKEDSDLRQFLKYFVAAARELFAESFTQLKSLLTAAEVPDISLIATVLSNEMDEIEQPFIVVLDDFYQIESSSLVSELISRILANPPITLHLVIITRRDPALSLNKMRALGQLSDVRMTDLKFQQSDIRQMLEVNTGIDISDEAIENLDDRLEGWPVGLRFLILALKHTPDVDSFLRNLQGGVQQITEYFLHEVINRQSPQIREWLLKSAVFNRFCESLVNDVLSSDVFDEKFGTESFIQALNNENLFVISLDVTGEWYRYHQLFQSILSDELSKQYSEAEIKDLHIKASVWFEKQELVDEAITHALAAGDENLAAGVIERNYHALLNQDQFPVLDQWISKISADVIRVRPALLLLQAYLASYRQQIDRIVPLLDQIDQLLHESPQDAELATESNLFKGYVHFWAGETELAECELESVIKANPVGKQLLLAETEVHLGLSRYMNGKFEMAIQQLMQRIQETEQSDTIMLPRLIGTIAIIHLLAGNLIQSRQQASRMAAIANPELSSLNYAWAHYLVGVSQFHAANLEEALQSFMVCSKYSYSTDARAAVDAMAGLALTQQLLSRNDAANRTVQDLLSFCLNSNDPGLTSIAYSCEARVNLLQGNLMRVIDWALSSSEQVDRLGLLIWLESPPLTQARILIQHGTEKSLRKAGDLLENIREVSGKSLLVCQQIEAGVLQSLLLLKLGQDADARSTIEAAVELCSASGWVRPFVELGEAILPLPESDQNDDDSYTEFRNRVLAAINDATDSFTSVSSESGRSSREIAWTGELLTKRELEILELLARRLQNKEIAASLYVSPETVKTHLKHLYQKLGVNNRRHAADKAHEILQIMPERAAR